MVGLSQEDIERIQAFANTPRYQRNPSGLMPDGEDGDESETERADAETRNGGSQPTDDSSKSAR